MNVCVFCGSSLGDIPLYSEIAAELGTLLGKANCTLIYGGGKVGLMGILADHVLKQNGQVIGVIPDFLMRREVAHLTVTKLEVVPSMHDRKKRMAELSDAFVAMPGGWGTLDELAEILTWSQLKLIDKPVFLLNPEGFFDHLIAQMKRMSESGFLLTSNLQSLKTVNTPRELIPLLFS